MTSQEDTSGSYLVKQAIDDSLLGATVEIDQHISAKNQIEGTSYRIGNVVKVQACKSHHSSSFNDNAHRSRSGADAPEHETLQERRWDFLSLFDGPNCFSCFVQ